MKQKLRKIFSNSFFNEKVLKKIILVFLCLQPILDIYYLYAIKGISKNNVFSPSTIIRMLFVFVLGIYALINHKKIFNEKKKLTIYIILFLVYSIFHFYNGMTFDTHILDDKYFSFLGEIFYFVRMLIPIFLFYLAYKLEFKIKDLYKVVFISSLLFSVVMIVTNIFYIALPSYDEVNKVTVNFFEWFNGANIKYNYKELGTKGIFHMANQVSGVLALFLPIMISSLLEKFNYKKIISIILHIIAMVMLGTRVGTFSALIITLLSVIIYFMVSIINKEKIYSKKIVTLILLFGFTLFLYYYSPIRGREFSNKLTKQATTELKEIEKSDDNKVISEPKKVEIRDAYYIKKNSDYYLVRWIYPYQIYPAEDHLEFWNKVYSLPSSKRNTAREIQELILNDIKETSNSKSDILFGMSFTRLRNAKVYIERDVVTHYFSIGIFGILVLFTPYFYSILKSTILILVKRKEQMNFDNILLLLSIGLCVCSGIFSGNVLDELIVTIYLGVFSGTLLSQVSKSKKIDNSKKVSLIIPVYNTEEFLDRCLKSVECQTYQNFEAIIVNDGSKDDSEKIINKYLKKKPNIFKYYKKENGGLSSARNYGIKKSEGDYIAFLDSDDYLETDYLEKLIEKANEKDYDLIVCDFYYDWGKKKTKGNSLIYNDLDNKKEIRKVFTSIYPVAWNKLYKKELFNNLEFKLNVWYEDVEFLYRLLPLINSIGIVNKKLINYVQRTGTITKTFDKRLYNYIDNFNGIVDYYKNNGYYNYYEKELEYCYVRYILGTFIKQATNYSDKEEYDKAVNKAINSVNEQFNDYHKNKYLLKSIKGFYLKIFNKNVADKLYNLKQIRSK